MPELKANFKSVQSDLGGSLPGRLIFGIPGKDGGYYTIQITQPDSDTMRLTFTASKEGMEQIAPADILLPKGPKGEPGEVDMDQILRFIAEYLSQNPPQVAEKDPTVPDWAKQPIKPKYTAKEVGAVATVNGQTPDENGNVEIEIPEAGGAGLTATEKTLILSLFQNAIFKSDVSAILEQLETLWSNSEDGGEDSGGTDTPTLYIVTNKLTNVTNSNSSASVASGGSYTATLTPVGGCELESVKVTMGGTDITDWAYSGGVVNIASVTGNVVITATAKSSSNVTQDGSTLIIVAVPNVAQNGTTLTIS